MSLNEEETLRKAIREAIKRVTEDNTKQVTKELVAEAHCPSSKRDDYMEEDTVTEDSGEEEAWHQWKNEHADDDHIKFHRFAFHNSFLSSGAGVWFREITF